MEDTPQPKISFLRTKRFWFRWAVPGLLLALWVEGMLFRNFIGISRTTTSSETVFYFSMEGGVASLSVLKEIFPSGFSWMNDWNYFGSSFKWGPRVRLLAPLIQADENASGCLSSSARIWAINLPLWPPLILWLLIAHIWSIHQKRKQAALHQSSGA